MKKALLLPLLFLLLQVQAQEGALDPTFGNGGFVHLGQNFSVPINRSPIPYSTAFTPEGKLVGVKITNNGFAVYRYDNDGALDASFGQNGVVNLNIPEIVVNALNLGQDEVLVAVQDNGKIVVAVKGVTADSYQYVVALVRLTSTGFLDPTFGSGGIAKTFFQTQTFHHQPSLVALAVHTDGRIATLINRTYYRLNYYNINYNADGSLDNSWGGPSGSLIYTNGQIALGSDGSLVYAQTVTEYVSNGPSNLWLFLNGQSINTGSNVFSYEGVSALALQPDGKILIQSISGNLYRFFTDGTLDGTFGNGGVIRSPLLAYKILVQSNGKIIIGGETQNNVNHDFALARLNPDGALDPSFGIGGIIASDFGGEERIENMGIAGNRLYAYGSGILTAYRLNTTTPPCTPPTFLNNSKIVLDASECGNDGNISIIPLSGTAPFMYSIDGGATYVAGGNAGHTFQELAAGTYQLRLKDANGCESAVVTREVRANVYPCNNAPCTPPTFLNNNQIVLDASCNGGDGAIYIIPTSGTAPFMYSIDGGATYVSGPNAGYAFQNLSAGTYQLRLKDSKGCESLVVTREVKANAFGPCAVPALSPRLRPVATEAATIRAYPNPSRGQFQVQLQRFASPKLQVQVLDSRGVVVQSRQVNAQETSTLDINLTGKAKGLYLIRVVSDKGTQTSKVTIQ